MADLHISPQAEMDLDQIWLYIARESKSPSAPDASLTGFPPSSQTLQETLIWAGRVKTSDRAIEAFRWVITLSFIA